MEREQFDYLLLEKSSRLQAMLEIPNLASSLGYEKVLVGGRSILFEKKVLNDSIETN